MCNKATRRPYKGRTMTDTTQTTTSTAKPKGDRWQHKELEATIKNPAIAMRAAAEAEREACAALCDSKVMALDHGGKEYYRPAPADRCAAAIRARGNSAEGLV